MVLATSRPDTVTKRWHDALLLPSRAGGLQVAPQRKKSQTTGSSEDIHPSRQSHPVPPTLQLQPPDSSLHPPPSSFIPDYPCSLSSAETPRQGGRREASCGFGFAHPTPSSHLRTILPQMADISDTHNDFAQHQMEYPEDPYFSQTVFFLIQAFLSS